MYMLNNILNDKSGYLITILVYIFLLYIIFEEIYTILKFNISYDSNFDYGRMLKSICNNEFVEYETSRFQLNNNINNLIIYNDKYNRKKYIEFILVLTIIISIIISFIFTYLVYNALINNEWINNFLELDDELEQIDMGKYNKIQAIFVRIYSVFTRFVYFFYNNFLNLGNKLVIKGLSESIFNLLLFIIIITAYIVVLGICVFIPLYITLKLTNTADISPFRFDISTSFSDLKINNIDKITFEKIDPTQANNYGNINYITIMYIIIFSFIILYKSLNIYYKDTTLESVSNNNLASYIIGNFNNLYTTNDSISYIIFFSYMALYIFMFYILGNVIYIYNKYNNENNDFNELLNFNKNLNDESKNIKDFINKYTRFNDDINNDIGNVNKRPNLFNTFMNKVIGFKEFNNYDVQNIYLNDLSGILFTIIIVAIVMIVIYYILSNFNLKTENSNLFRYGIIEPLIVLIIIIFIINITTTFNSYINNYLIYNPSALYKRYINDFNNIFTPIIKEEFKYSGKAYDKLCKNVANPILLVLYTSIFKYNIYNNTDNDIELLKLTSSNNSTTDLIDMTPEFTYIKDCNDNIQGSYNKLPEYNIEYYLNNKKLNKNIFYDLNNCSIIKDDVFINIINNLLIFDKNNINDILYSIKRDVYDNKSITDKTSYIKNVILEKNENINIVKNRLKKYLYNAIYNVNYNDIPMTYNNDNPLKYGTTIETLFINNKLNISNLINQKYYTDDRFIPPEDKELFQRYNEAKIYEDIINYVIEEYLNMICYNLYLLTPIIYELYDGKYYNINKQLTDTPSIKLKQKYISDLNELFIKTFSEINDILSNKYINEGGGLTKYIISNYNAIYTDNIFTKNTFNEVILKKSDKDVLNDSEISLLSKIDNILKLLNKNNDDINNIIGKLNNNEYNGTTFVLSLTELYNNINYSNSTYNSLYNSEDIIKILNQIYNNNDNKYILKYNITYLDNNKSDVIIIPNSMKDIILDAIKLQLQQYSYLYIIYQTKTKPEIGKIDIDNIGIYKNNIDNYNNVLKTNILQLISNYDLYHSKKIIKNNEYLNSEITDIDSDTYISITKNALKDANEVDKLIYIVVISYIILLIGTDYIL